jgi:sterol desaturase/sphingolipid hydroxylase (fatty acid hydroxylase superfamily)
MLSLLQAASWVDAALFFLLANALIFTCSAALCWLLGVVFRQRRIFERWEPLRRLEVVAAIGSIFLNAAVSVVGWWLWTQGLIHLRPGGAAAVMLDCVLMTLFMDLGMYGFHRLVHHPRLYGLFHRFHHRHETTNPISLFVLHPVEVLGFGGLMIVFLMIYHVSLPGLMIYLGLNVIFGTLGHSGVEPFPRRLQEVPLLRLIGTSTFHAEHHEHPRYNFGFYTLIWDKLFGTLDPEYDGRFAGKPTE